jgi:hypothetical protein
MVSGVGARFVPLSNNDDETLALLSSPNRNEEDATEQPQQPFPDSITDVRASPRLRERNLPSIDVLVPGP